MLERETDALKAELDHLDFDLTLQADWHEELLSRASDAGISAAGSLAVCCTVWMTCVPSCSASRWPSS